MTRARRSLALLSGVLAGGFVLAASSSASPPESGLAGWPRQIGTAGFDYISDVAVSSSDVYVAGTTYGSLPGHANAGGADAFLARYDKYGKLMWVRQFGTDERDEAMGITISGSSIYIGGQTEGLLPGQSHAGATDSFVARYDSNGNQKWVRQFGTDGNDWAQEIAYSSSDLYVTGHTTGAFPGETNVGPPTSTDVFVTRYSTSGTHELTYQFGTTKDDQGFGIAVSGSDTYVVGGTYGDMPGFMINTVDIADAYITRFDKSGTLKSVHQIGTGDADVAYDVALSGSQIYVTGETGGALPGAPSDPPGNDAFLIRYIKTTSAPWSPAWVTQFGGSSGEVGYGVAVRSSKIYVTGITSGAIPNWAGFGGLDGFVATFGTNGIEEWSRQFGTDGTDYSVAVAVRSSDSYGGAVVVVGYTDGTVFGQFASGSDDGFTAAFLK